MIELKSGIFPHNGEDISDFRPFLDEIRSDDIRIFTEAWLQSMPAYIFHVPASSSGKYHPEYELGEGGLKRHLLNVARVAIMLCEMQAVVENERDCVIAAALLHDMLKSGWQTDFEQNKHTRFDHPRLAAQAILDTVSPVIPEESKCLIANCIISHMGRWNTDKYTGKPDLPVPETELQKLIHTADYIASRKNIMIKE